MSRDDGATQSEICTGLQNAVKFAWKLAQWSSEGVQAVEIESAAISLLLKGTG